MLDMGFIHDIKKVLAVLPAKKQSLLFSATFSDEIKTLADACSTSRRSSRWRAAMRPADNIAQKVHPVSRDRKKELLAHLIKSGDWHQVLVFTRMKHGANRLTEFLEKEGISAMAIHGNKSQGARTKALSEFKSGDLRVLVATDIAGARHRHRPAAARGELRDAQRPGRLRAPHRPHRPRRRPGRGHLARVRRRGHLPRRHREVDQAQHPARGRARLRAQPA
jgi:superfamily II DNA/RNA helicase